MMTYSMYNNLVLKVESLDEKLNKITKGTRGSHDSSAIYSYFRGNPQHNESIQSLVELANNIKQELRYLLIHSPKNRKTMDMYNKVCVLESELSNLIDCIQHSNPQPRVNRSKHSYGVIREIPMKGISDYPEVSPGQYCMKRISFTPRGLKRKVFSNRRFKIITEPEHIFEKKNSSDSYDMSSYYLLSSSGSSSTVTIDQSRKPPFIRKSKSLYIARPSSNVRIGQRTPERLPIHVRKSNGSSRRNREKIKERKPNLKKSSLKLGVHKSDLNKINVYANDLQTHETEVFLIKKKRKPSRPREQFGKDSSTGRYFISRLKRVVSGKNRPLVLTRSKSPNIRKSSSPEHGKEKVYVKKNSSKKFSISKMKETDPSFEYSSSSKYSEESFHNEGSAKKHFKERFGPKKYVKSKRFRDSKPVVVARSSNLNKNPFFDESHMLYLQDNSLVLVTTRPSSKYLYLPRNRGDGKPFSKGVKETLSRNFIKPVMISNHHKKSNISNTDSNYEIVDSYQNSSLYLKKNDILSHKNELNSLSSGSKNRHHSQLYDSLQENSANGIINRCDYTHNSKKYGDNSSYSRSKHQNSKKSKVNSNLSKDLSDTMPQIKGKGNCSNLNNKHRNISLNKRPTLNKDNSFYNNPSGFSVIETSIYLAAVPETFAQNNIQNLPPENNSAEKKIEGFNYIVNSAHDIAQNKESPNSVNISNPNHYASSYLKSSPSGKSQNIGNDKKPTSTKYGFKKILLKTLSKVNTHPEIDGTGAPLQNTRSLLIGPSISRLHPTSRSESHTELTRSNVSNNHSPTSNKSNMWLPRSLSKLSNVSKRREKTKREKGDKSVMKEASKNSSTELSKQGSKEKQPSPTEKPSKAGSWTSLKRTMSGVGSLIHLNKNIKTEKQGALKKVGSENKLKKQPSLLKRMFSKEKRSKSKIREDKEVKNNSKYEGDKTSLSPTSLISNTVNSEHSKIEKLHGYQVGSKLSKKGLDIKKDKQKSIKASGIEKNKKSSPKDNSKAFNYSLHYSKEKHKCVEMDLVPSMLCLANSSSKELWSMNETVLSEHELTEFEKHNKYYEYLFKPNKCQGCTVHNKKVSKVCQSRSQRKSLARHPLNNRVCNSVSDNLHIDPVSYSKSTTVTTTDNYCVSDSSDICDWKKIANEMKQCHKI